MKNMKRAMTAVLACILLLCSPLTAARARDYSKAEYGNTRWMKMKEDYLGTKTDRLIFVKHEGGTNASVEMWKKVSVTEHNLTAAKGSADRKKAPVPKRNGKRLSHAVPIPEQTVWEKKDRETGKRQKGLLISRWPLDGKKHQELPEYLIRS